MVIVSHFGHDFLTSLMSELCALWLKICTIILATLAGFSACDSASEDGNVAFVALSEVRYAQKLAQRCPLQEHCRVDTALRVHSRYDRTANTAAHEDNQMRERQATKIGFGIFGASRPLRP
jgi:hypothetical protein